MDSDSVNRELDKVRERLSDWVLSGTTEGAEKRRKALGRLMKAIFIPCVIGLVGGSIFLSKWGNDLGMQKEAPHKLLGTLEETYASSASDETGASLAVVEKTGKELGEELVKKPEPKKGVVREPTATPESKEVTADTPPLTIPKVTEPIPSVQIVQKEEVSVTKQETVPSQSPTTAPDSVMAPRAILKRSVFPATFGFGKSKPILLTEDLELFKLIINGCSGTLVIEGHSDGLGTPDRNDDISRSRASAVSQLLLSRGLLDNGKRYEVTSMGGTRPVAKDSTEEGRAANRRVEIWCRS
jgi:outer membrane protein OmpA-like peptidoglycan-associated protein